MLQINIGFVCNFVCCYCYVELLLKCDGIGENMLGEMMCKVFDWFVVNLNVEKIDVIGGSLEMNLYYCDFVIGVCKFGFSVMY